MIQHWKRFLMLCFSHHQLGFYSTSPYKTPVSSSRPAGLFLNTMCLRLVSLCRLLFFYLRSSVSLQGKFFWMVHLVRQVRLSCLPWQQRKVEETDKYFSAADAGTRPELRSGGHEEGGGYTGRKWGIKGVNKDSPIFTMKQEMDVLTFTLQLFISAL